MKKPVLFSFLLFFISIASYSQQINHADLIGTWDQTSGAHPATILFVDSIKVKYSYKGHTGVSPTYYYLLNNANRPVILTVDFSQKHKKHRDEYLIQFVDKDTIKLQVLYKKTAGIILMKRPKTELLHLHEEKICKFLEIK